MKKEVRKRILDILAEPSTVTAIRTKLKDVGSFGTIAYHLKELYDKGVIGREKDKTKRGSPTKYYLINKDVIKKVREVRKSRSEAILEILNKIKETPMIEDRELIMYLERLGLSEELIDEILNCSNESLTTVHHKITPKGLKFLEANAK